MNVADTDSAIPYGCHDSPFAIRIQYKLVWRMSAYIYLLRSIRRLDIFILPIIALSVRAHNNERISMRADNTNANLIYFFFADLCCCFSSEWTRNVNWTGPHEKSDAMMWVFVCLCVCDWQTVNLSHVCLVPWTGIFGHIDSTHNECIFIFLSLASFVCENRNRSGAPFRTLNYLFYPIDSARMFRQPTHIALTNSEMNSDQT